jgi:hypothetical protein
MCEHSKQVETSGEARGELSYLWLPFASVSRPLTICSPLRLTFALVLA